MAYESDTKINDLGADNDLYGAHHLQVKGFRQNYSVFDSEQRKHDHAVFFCDWQPKLFGIDEDEIPDTDDEEGLFDLEWEGLVEQAQALTEQELNEMRVGNKQCLNDTELRAEWLRVQQPRYGRRARQKVVFLNDKNEPFDCHCEVDLHYCRHHRPRFGGGVVRKDSEFRMPHFKAFWEEVKDGRQTGDTDHVSNLLKHEEPEEEKVVFERPTFKYKGTTKRFLQKKREETLSTFRPLQCRDIRRYRIPYSEALYLELQEDGYLEAAAFFKHLIINDHFVHQTLDNNEPRLRDNRLMLNKIYEILKLAEKLSKREEYHKVAYLYIRTGKYFNDFDWNWLWLAEEFYVKAVNVSANCVIDGGKAEAIANYMLGMFLLDCVGKVQPAQEHLLKARELSMGKDWSARNVLQKHQDTVHKECATYLCRALIAASKELRKNGKPEEALPLIHRAYKLCEELGSWGSEIDLQMYFELGMTYQAVGMMDWAKTAFRRFIGIAETKNFVKGVCDGYLEVAICYRSDGDSDRCHWNLKTYLEKAQEKENENLVAFGNRYLGEFLLNSGKSEEAAKYLKVAFNSFLKQCTEVQNIPFKEWEPEHFTLPADVELTRALCGLAEGEMITKIVYSLIFEAKDDRKAQETILHLIKWKNTGDKNHLKNVGPILQKIAETPSPETEVVPEPETPEEMRAVRFAPVEQLMNK